MKIELDNLEAALKALRELKALDVAGVAKLKLIAQALAGAKSEILNLSEMLMATGRELVDRLIQDDTNKTAALAAAQNDLAAAKSDLATASADAAAAQANLAAAQADAITPEQKAAIEALVPAQASA